MKWARVIHGIATDVITHAPDGYYTPVVVAQFVQVEDDCQNGYTKVSGVWVAPRVSVTLPTNPLPLLKLALISQINSDIDAIYASVLGNRADQYNAAEQAALAYKAAGYSGPVPARVQSWASAKNRTTTQAADDIIAAMGTWHTQQDAIWDKGLLRKQQARNSPDVDTVNQVKTAWDNFVSAVTNQLAGQADIG